MARRPGPGPRRLSEVRDILRANASACVFLEPQIPARAVEAVTDGTNARIAVLDPLGADIPPGPGLYGAVILGVARSMRDCMTR